MENNISSLISLAESGDAEAQSFLGAALCTGAGVDKDLVGGLYWYFKAIEQGFVEAKWNAGSMIIDGEGSIQKNQDLGMSLIKEAAEAGEPGACAFLQDCYENGYYGLVTDIKMSEFWKRKQYAFPKITFDFPRDVFSQYSQILIKPKL